MIWDYREQRVLPVYILAMYPLVLSSYESFIIQQQMHQVDL